MNKNKAKKKKAEKYRRAEYNRRSEIKFKKKRQKHVQKIFFSQ